MYNQGDSMGEEYERLVKAGIKAQGQLNRHVTKFLELGDSLREFLGITNPKFLGFIKNNSSGKVFDDCNSGNRFEIVEFSDDRKSMTYSMMLNMIDREGSLFFINSHCIIKFWLGNFWDSHPELSIALEGREIVCTKDYADPGEAVQDRDNINRQIVKHLESNMHYFAVKRDEIVMDDPKILV